MKFHWDLKDKAYEDYRKDQHEYTDDDCGDGTYIGAVRIGDLCFDILDWGNHLWFDLYVGGVNTGYGSSIKQEYLDYPYDFADVCSFRWDKDVKEISIKKFREEVSEFIKFHLQRNRLYTPVGYNEPVDLLNKANEELKIW